jgi:hypothetical protein
MAVIGDERSDRHFSSPHYELIPDEQGWEI